MKRDLSSSSSSSVEEDGPVFSPALLSQATVPGAEQACTTIAVMACAWSSARPLVSTDDMELWIRQGAALYAAWRRSNTQAPVHAFAKEVIDLVSPALPICAGDEHGGVISVVSLAETFALLLAPNAAAVLTCGALSIALLRGGTEVFDSHPQPDHNNCAVHIRFASREQAQAYLLQRYVGMAFSLCVVKKRVLHHVPRTFPKQELAFQFADRLPPGFFYVFARDINRDGTKEYQVAGWEDFCHYYYGLVPVHRTHYDLARDPLPVTLYVDPEYDLFEENRRHDPREMLSHLLRDISAQWAEETGMGMDEVMAGFRVTDSSTGEPMDLGSEDVPGEEDASGSGLIEDEEEDEEDNEASVSKSLGDDDSVSRSLEDEEEDEGEGENGKVSFHVHNQTMWFANAAKLGEFMLRVEQRASPGLKVWRKVWNARDKRHEMAKQFFADLSVYTRNRCFRLPFATKYGKARPFLPLDMEDAELSREFLSECLLCPPMLKFYQLMMAEKEGVPCASAPSGASSFVSEVAMVRSGSGSDVNQLSESPVPIRMLANVVESHYKPERMRGFQVAPTGLVTFPMVKHDCEICNDKHNNQVYVVADLKRRIMYSKCHVDRSKEGPPVPFPEALNTLSMADEAEMQPGERSVLGIFTAESSTARMVLGFASAIFESARRTAPRIPQPGSAPIHYNKVETQYEATLPDVCPLDGGGQVLQVSLNKMILKCKGKQCTAKGKRWERPSHSGTSSKLWNLSFLFPPRASLAIASAGGFPSFVASPEAFLAQPNLFLALGFKNSGAPRTVYTARLKEMNDWCLLKLKESGSEIHEQAAQVFYKANIIGKILWDELMEVCYRECLAVAPEFVYPTQLIPRGPSTIASALFIHLARQRGYKRVENDFYLPVTDDAGRTFYRAVPMDQLLTSVCNYKVTPNLCASVMWNGRVCDDLRRLLNDRNHFPSLPLSKRYLAYANVVYDLEANVTLTWDQVRADPTIMPFNFLDQQFPVEMLEQAKANCPNVAIVKNEKTGATEVQFDCPSGLNFVSTPLFDGPLHDQQFSDATIFWLYALLGRMFHYVGKQGGDNWEIMVFLMGAPGSFKSSIIAILQKFLQACQVGILGTRVEAQFPIDDLMGKLMAFMTECGGCTLERDLLKQMSSGDSLRVAGKHKTAICVPEWIIPLLFAGNAFLNVIDTDGSLCRRVALFPFLYMLRDGQGVTDLADRIFRTEGPLLLIKWNTLYLKMRSSIKSRIQGLLPAEIRAATRQAVMAGDSFKSFFAQSIIVTGSRDDSIPWDDVMTAYKKWCKLTGRQPYMVDCNSVEVQAMLKGFGVRLSRHRSPVSLIKARPRAVADPPFRNVLEVGDVRREGDEEESKSSASASEE